MKIGLFAVIFCLGIAPVLAGDQISGEPEYQALEQTIMLFYNHIEILDKNTEAKLAVEKLIQQYPDNPWLYDLWAAIEWNVIGLELGIKLEERQNILDKPFYRQRAEKYYQMIAQGLQLTELVLANSDLSRLEQQQWLFAKAALYFASGKFSIRFEEHLEGLRKGDKAGAQGIQELKKILAQDPHFGPAFFLLGIIRYELSRQGFIYRTLIKWGTIKSASYKELRELRDSVFDKEESVAWIEKTKRGGAPEPWLKRNWLEAALALERIYNRQREDYDAQEELTFIERKYLPLLELLANTLPENIKFAQKLEQTRNYLRRKQNN